jgi:UDP-N-acetylmuramyl tripeptide synthase
LINAAVRSVRRGGGTVLGGRVGLGIDPHLLSRLTAGRPVACVTGTNGKTTTTRLLVAALAHGPVAGEGPAGVGRPVATNATGANMPAGHVAALAGAPPGVPVVLEVDEGYVPRVVDAVGPAVVVCLNLSRDQLDRMSEVRMLARRWRAALGGAAGTTVVANADDPLVVWGAGASPHVVWVAAGLGWRFDAVGCPACEGRIEFEEAGAGWSCRCGFARPEPDVTLVDRPDGGVTAVFPDGTGVPVALGVPGRFNAANAAMAAVAAGAFGVEPADAIGSMASVTDVGGRYSVRDVGGVPTRLMLAKNPAGWQELLGLVCPGAGPVVVGINARVADGRDPSWLWDVPFERLAGRPVVATGERCLDLAVRLHYAEVAHRTVRDPVEAIDVAARGVAGTAATAGVGGTAGVAGAGRGAAVDFIGNYTAFFDVVGRR